MGQVLLCHRETDGALVAVKLIRRTIAGTKSGLYEKRFKRELEISKRLAHPYIAKVLDGGSTKDGSLFIAIEYLQGRTLADCAEEENGLPEGKCRLIAAHLAEALEYLHDLGLLHRDLKPANIMLEGADRTVLLDFGLAYDNNQTRLTATGQVVGTFICMAPEQARDKELGPCSDIYSLGISLFFGATGRFPYASSTDVYSILEGREPPKVPHLFDYAQVSKPFSRLVRRCMAIDPMDRFQSSTELKEAIALLDSDDGSDEIVFERGSYKLVEGNESKTHQSSGKRKPIFAALLLLIACLLGVEKILEEKPAPKANPMTLCQELISKRTVPTIDICKQIGVLLDGRVSQGTDFAAHGLFYLAKLASREKHLDNEKAEYAVRLYDILLERHGYWTGENEELSLRQRVNVLLTNGLFAKMIENRLNEMLQRKKPHLRKEFLTAWMVELHLMSLANDAGKSSISQRVLYDFVKENIPRCRQDERAKLYNRAASILMTPLEGHEDVARMEANLASELLRSAVDQATTIRNKSLYQILLSNALWKSGKQQEAHKELEGTDVTVLTKGERVWFLEKKARQQMWLSHFSRAYENINTAIALQRELGKVPQSLFNQRDLIRARARLVGAKL